MKKILLKIKKIIHKKLDFFYINKIYRHWFNRFSWLIKGNKKNYRNGKIFINFCKNIAVNFSDNFKENFSRKKLIIVYRKLSWSKFLFFKLGSFFRKKMRFFLRDFMLIKIINIRKIFLEFFINYDHQFIKQNAKILINKIALYFANNGFKLYLNFTNSYINFKRCCVVSAIKSMFWKLSILTSFLLVKIFKNILLKSSILKLKWRNIFKLICDKFCKMQMMMFLRIFLAFFLQYFYKDCKK
jgi:hypothetical protein